MWRRATKAQIYLVQTDAALAVDGKRCGLGVVIRDEAGVAIRWLCEVGTARTNMEAEYAALCLALETMAAEGATTVHVFSDCEVVVHQMDGRFRVQSATLRPWHQRACAAARRMARVTYTHIPRGRNRLADALANEALQARLKVSE